LADLRGVHPAVAQRAALMLDYFNRNGWPLVLTSGFRSEQHQQELIAQGITQARQSRHTLGFAFDVSFPGLSREAALRLPEWVWLAVGKAGESLGLRWGGRFNDYDPFHFDAG
jgi:hypothetical protein